MCLYNRLTPDLLLGRGTSFRSVKRSLKSNNSQCGSRTHDLLTPDKIHPSLTVSESGEPCPLVFAEHSLTGSGQPDSADVRNAPYTSNT